MAAKRRVLIWVGLGLCAAGLLIFVATRWPWRSVTTPPRARTAPLEWAAADELVANFVAQWAQAEKVPLANKIVKSQLSDMSRRVCLPIPEGARPLRWQDLSAQQRRSLVVLLNNIVEAEVKSSPELHFEWRMRQGYTRLKDAVRNRLIRLLKERGRQSVQELTDQELFVEFFTHVEKAASHWIEWLPDSSCMSIWTGGPLSIEGLEAAYDLQDYEFSVWRHIRGDRLYFTDDTRSPRPSMLDEALVVDMRVIVISDAACDSNFIPYVFRFLFEPDRNDWRLLRFLDYEASPPCPNRVLML